MNIRLASLADIPFLQALIEESVMTLQASDYSEVQRRNALGTVFGIDSQLIKDQTYFVVEAEGIIVGCGGWSYRRTLFGSDAIADKNDTRLNPKYDAARIRAFFVKPGWERRGIGTKILQACETAAQTSGFKRFELVATLTGVRLYSTYGYEGFELYETPLPDGLTLRVVRMAKMTASN